MATQYEVVLQTLGTEPVDPAPLPELALDMADPQIRAMVYAEAADMLRDLLRRVLTAADHRPVRVYAVFARLAGVSFAELGGGRGTSKQAAGKAVLAVCRRCPELRPLMSAQLRRVGALADAVGPALPSRRRLDPLTAPTADAALLAALQAERARRQTDARLPLPAVLGYTSTSVRRALDVLDYAAPEILADVTAGRLGVGLAHRRTMRRLESVTKPGSDPGATE